MSASGGAGVPRAHPRLVAAAAAAVGALVPALLLRGFTVDDALIPARYAAHLARGIGYRFNAAGPVTDGVTPLGWAHLLAPFAAGGALDALRAAKILGIVSHVIGAALLGAAIHGVSDRRVRFLPLAMLACSAPLAAWAGAGLETGFVAAIASVSVAAREMRRPWMGSVAAGLAAALRPELLPWALVIAVAPGPATELEQSPAPRMGSGWGAAAARAAVAAAPFAAVAAVRASTFGRLAPLSALAKPPDASLGARYALACFLLTGPIALLAPVAWTRLAAWPRALLLATAAHFLAVAAAGGDWMALSRLVVPVLPTVLLAAAHVASVADARWAAARVALAVAAELYVMLRVGPVAAGVGEDRARVMAELGPILRRADVIASVDVGWVGAVSDATIVDLAGVTDPAIAVLPGGHTSKHIPPGLLDARRVDTLVLLLERGQAARSPWYESRFDRGVEYRIAWIARDEFELAAESHGQLRYVVLRRSQARLSGARRDVSGATAAGSAARGDPEGS